MADPTDDNSNYTQPVLTTDPAKFTGSGTAASFELAQELAREQARSLAIGSLGTGTTEFVGLDQVKVKFNADGTYTATFETLAAQSLDPAQQKTTDAALGELGINTLPEEEEIDQAAEVQAEIERDVNADLEAQLDGITASEEITDESLGELGINTDLPTDAALGELGINTLPEEEEIDQAAEVQAEIERQNEAELNAQLDGLSEPELIETGEEEVDDAAQVQAEIEQQNEAEYNAQLDGLTEPEPVADEVTNDALGELGINTDLPTDAALGELGINTALPSRPPSAQVDDPAKDWRFKISLAESAKYLYNSDPPGILFPLKATNGVVYPYTPQINITYLANYSPTDLTHSNFKMQNYTNSSIESISITGDFTAQDTTEANYILAVIHFFKSVTKMFYGKDTDPPRGVPPPLCYLTGYGAYAFDRHPVVITSFTLNYPNDVDYINANSNHTSSQPILGGGQAGFVPYTPPSINNSSPLQRLAGSGLKPGGGPAAPAWSKFKAFEKGDDITRVPTKISIQISALPIVTRYDYSNKFSLKDYATGKLLRGSKGYGTGGGIW